MSKKFIALALAAALAMGIGTAAYAENTTGGSTTVEYTEEATYTVNIPAKVTYDKAAGAELTFTAENVVLPKGQTAKVSTTATTIEMSTGGENADTFTVALKQGDAVYVAGSAVAQFATGATEDTATGKLKLAPQDASAKINAGTYTGTLTFTVAVS